MEAQLPAQAIFTASGRVAAVLFSQLSLRTQVKVQLPVIFFNFQTIAIKQKLAVTPHSEGRYWGIGIHSEQQSVSACKLSFSSVDISLLE